MKHSKRIFVGILSASIAFNSCIPALAADSANYSLSQENYVNYDSNLLSHSENMMTEQLYENIVSDNSFKSSLSANESVGYARSGMMHYDDAADDQISFSSKKMVLEVGEVKKIDIGEKSSRISWISSNPNVAAVDVNGEIIAIAKGKARITAWYNGKKHSFSVKVKQSNETGSLSKAELLIPVGKSRSFPSLKGIPRKTLTISSNDPEVISVDNAKKRIKGITGGSADLYYEYDYQDKKGNHTGKGKIRCCVISPNAEEKNISIRIGETQKLKLSGNYGSKTIWKSSNKKVAFVDELGVVTGLAEGNATITCKCGGKKIKYKVSVAGETNLHDHSKESDDYVIWKQNRFTTLHFYKCGNFNIEQNEPYNNLLDNSEKSNSNNNSNSNNSVSNNKDNNNSDASTSENKPSNDVDNEKKNGEKDIPDVGPGGKPDEKNSSDRKDENSEIDKETIDLNRVYENGLFRYKYEENLDGEYSIVIIGLTDTGKKESVIVIPKDIDGYPVKKVQKDSLTGNNAENIILEAEIEKSDLPAELSGTGKGNVFTLFHKYSVIHERENIDGTYEVAEKENFEAETGKSIIPEVKDYFGFESPKYQLLKVKADDSSCVTYRYKRKKYTVSVNAGRGIASVSGSGIYKYEQDAKISAETKPGYSFDGWMGDANNWMKDRLESHFRMPATNIELTAKAIPINYAITYDLRGGSITDDVVKTYNTESANFVIEKPVKKGYEFAGWICEDTETPKVDLTIEKGSIGDRNYIATWAARNDTPYKVYHEKEKIGGGYETAEIEELKGTTGKNVTPKVKVYEGFSKPAEQTVEVDAEGTAQVTYRYQRLSYNLSVKYNKGFKVADREEKHKYQEDINISTALKDGYRLVGLKDGSGKAIASRFKMPANNLNVVAAAEPQVYTITYNLNGGINNSKNPRTYTIETNSFNLQAPSRTGYTFAGWTGSNGNTKEYNIGFVKDRSFGNKNYTANWTANAYVINFNSDGGSAVAPMKVIYSNKAGSLPTPSKTNYTFVGWYNKNGAKVDGNMVMPAENITLTARWQQITRSIVITGDGGKYGTSTEIRKTCKDGEKITLSKPVRNGYRFMGWKVTGAGSLNGNVFTVGKGDARISSIWSELYKVTINIDNSAAGGNVKKTIVKEGIAGEKIKIDPPDFNDKNTRFVKWKYTGNGSFDNNTVTIGNKNNRLDTEVERIIYITYELDNGIFYDNSKIKTVLKQGEQMILPRPHKGGYRFLSWYIAGDGKQEEGLFTAGKNDVKLYAMWQKV